MGEINLREFYSEIYKEDYVVTLPDEVVEVLLESRQRYRLPDPYIPAQSSQTLQKWRELR